MSCSREGGFGPVAKLVAELDFGRPTIAVCVLQEFGTPPHTLPGLGLVHLADVDGLLEVAGPKWPIDSAAAIAQALPQSLQNGKFVTVDAPSANEDGPDRSKAPHTT